MPEAFEELTEEEKYLYCILQDPLDLAEFAWYDPRNDDGCFRAFPYQVSWWRCDDAQQINACARSVGKTESIKLRAYNFPFQHPGQEMLITAPELIHLEPIIQTVEFLFNHSPLGRAMISKPATHRPFMLEFKNGAKIHGRIPQRDGKGVLGTHPLMLEHDEASVYPERGWDELVETVKRGHDGARWMAHGVTQGIGNKFHQVSAHGLHELPLRPQNHAEEGKFTVHRIPAMCHPAFNEAERRRKEELYDDVSEYRRNVMGLPGDAVSALFRMASVMQNVEDDVSAEYNNEIFMRHELAEKDLATDQRDILEYLMVPPSHMKYDHIWAGMDVGLLRDASEILLFAEVIPTETDRKANQRRPKEGLYGGPKGMPTVGVSRLMLIARISMKHISEPAQAEVILWCCENYNIERFAMDSTGIGLPLFQNIQYQSSSPDPMLRARAQRSMNAIKDYNFKSNILVGFDERVKLDTDALKEKIDKQGLERNVKEWASDQCRVYVEDSRLWLPWDAKLKEEGLLHQMGQATWKWSTTEIDQYGQRRKTYSKGGDHALDALRMAVLGHSQNTIDALLAMEPEHPPILEYFLGPDDFLY